jgi:hypothetical protein
MTPLHTHTHTHTHSHTVSRQSRHPRSCAGQERRKHRRSRKRAYARNSSERDRTWILHCTSQLENLSGMDWRTIKVNVDGTQERAAESSDWVLPVVGSPGGWFSSVDRPRCQPGLRKEADFGLYAAVRFLLADRLAPEALRPLASQLLFGDPLRYRTRSVPPLAFG